MSWFSRKKDRNPQPSGKRDLGEEFATHGKEVMAAMMRVRVQHLTSEMLPRFNRQYAGLWEEASEAQRSRLVELIAQLMVSSANSTAKSADLESFQRWMDGNSAGPVPKFIADALQG